MLITRFSRVFWVDSSSKIFRKSKERLRYCDSEAHQELQTHRRGSVSVFFFWLMCIFERTRLPDFPSQFAKQQIQENEEMATLRFSDRSWPVKLLSYMHEIRVFFASGWPVFAELIGVWEISVFELIDTSPFSLMPVGSNHLHEEQAILSWIFMVLHFQGLSHLP
ncbi:uncharacterized protein LOC115730515 isoform X1 [Rhodamnia argentea]|uniref:Uncharacterized protein LOC115730515 isoform X1 n=1 Tax=Rhodamnia argentea TaxID=178133 RepID=A0A8B8N4R1_9MYRT|nr:uncharacterized protein LOC115730515 isoform X1 [Rhodamnia argentea]